MSVTETTDWMQEAATSVLRTESVFPTYHFYDRSIQVMYDDAEHSYFRYDAEGNHVEIPSVTTILHAAIDKSFALIPWATKLCVEKIRAGLVNEDGTLKQIASEDFNALLEEGKNQHKVKLEEAGDIGTAVHNALEMAAKKAIAETDGYIMSAAFIPTLPENYVQGSDVKLELRTSLARNCFLAALTWYKRHNVQFMFTERKVYSKTYDYAGTTDGVIYVDSCDDLECCRGKVFKRQLADLDLKSSSGMRDEFPWQLAAYQFALIEELGLPITHRYILRLGKEDGRFESWLLDPTFFADDLDTFLNALRLYKSLEGIRARRSADKKELRVIIKAQKEALKTAKLEAERLEKLAKKEALAAIKQADKAEREEAKLEAKLAKQQAKPSLALVPSQCHPINAPWTPVPCEVKAAQPKETKNDTTHTTSINDAVGEDDHTGRVRSLAGDDVGVSPLPELPTIAKRGFDESFWEGGFSVGADGKVADIKAAAAKPGIAHTMHGNAEPRATRFWTTSMTYTIAGRIL
jgi:hypothetical protein